MTFKNLKFKPHKVIPKKGIQATLEVKPNVFISVIAGEGFYQQWDVQGWQSREDINNLLKNV